MRGLTCREATDLAGDHLDGTLQARDDAALQAHLAICPGCTRFVEQLATTVSFLRRLGDRGRAG